MDFRRVTVRYRPSLIAGLTAIVFVVAAGEASATCFAPRTSSVGVQPGSAFAPLAAAVGSSSASTQGSGPIVGLWRSLYTLDDTAIVYDETFQQFHADGTELMVSGGVPPTIGNVCVGVWERGSGGQISLRHVTWNWNGDEILGDPPTGYFLLEVTLRTNEAGNGFSGTWRAASYDLDAVPGSDPPQPGSEAQGIVRAVRIEVD